MIRFKQATASALAIGAVAAIAGVASAASVDGPQATSPAPTAELSATHDLARTHGADVSSARVVGSLEDGARIAVAPTQDGKCVLVSGGTFASGDLCAPAARVEEGKAASVLNDCSVPHGRMQITALLPTGAVAGRLSFSNGTVGPVLDGGDGAVWFDGTTPGEGEVFPTGIQALDSNGSQTEAIALPVTGSAFCLPVPSPLSP